MIKDQFVGKFFKIEKTQGFTVIQGCKIYVGQNFFSHIKVGCNFIVTLR